MQSNKTYFDVVVVIPLEEEYLHVVDILREKEDLSTKTNFICTVDCGSEDINVLLVQQYKAGNTHARTALSIALQEREVGVIACLGIAGCLSDDLNLGDVCYSTKIIDVHDNGKMSSSKDGKLELRWSPVHYDIDQALVASFSFVRQKKNLRPLYEQWQKECESTVAKLGTFAVPGRNLIEERLGSPSSRDGVVVCAQVVTSEEYKTKLMELDRKVLIVDTESAGVHEAANQMGIPAITIRGISDYSDYQKKNLEVASNGIVRKIAMRNAASFLCLQLRNPEFRNYLNRRREISQSSSGTITTGLPANKTPLSEIVSEIANIIDEKLRELCPGYKLQQKGCRLPVPRIRHIQHNNAIGESSRGRPVDLGDALRTHSSLLLRLPRTYPDYGLPWVISGNLLTAELSGRQALPVVIDGAYMRPPNAGFKNFISQSIEDIDPTDGIQLIYIIDNIPAESKSKLAFLKKEIAATKDAKFIFITRDESHFVDLTEFANEQKADTFEVCAISFHEIANFIQTNFSMSGSEAEVIAFRLRETFEQFDLSAHPTYFAGIPKEVLFSLLNANRRSELIQLAVDGFLTFLVADDQSNITLSRTTRSKFLRLLAIEINVKKNPLLQSQLVEFAEQFSSKHDYGIDPLAFVGSFLNKGILNFSQNGHVRFSLPFMESYLLADELARFPITAYEYFDFLSSPFDFITFDLYSEIGASHQIVDTYLEFIGLHIEVLDIHDLNHVLLADRVHPPMLKHPSRMQDLQRRLRKAVDDVQQNRGDTKEKQRIIDAAEHVKETATKRAKPLPSEDAITPVAFSSSLDDAVQAWVIGVILLGRGVEHLLAGTKQTLAKELLVLGSFIIHHWTEERLQIDFAALKEELRQDDRVKNLFQQRTTLAKDSAESHALIGLLVDTIQYHLLSEPFRCVIEHLCENARHGVLATSVEKAQVEDPMEQILRCAWLTDIDSARGKRALYDAIRNLPTSPFLRTNLATHFLTRVHWSHWRKEDRLTLLDAAEEAIQPLAISFDKGELKRNIEKDADVAPK